MQTGNKHFWTLLFSTVPVFCTWFFWVAARETKRGWWLPEDFSTYGAETDHLFNLILAITSVTFILVNMALVYVMWKYAAGDTPKKAEYVHGNHRLEVIWTVIPALILVFIAVYQWSTWLKIKKPSRFPEVLQEQLAKKQPFCEVLAGQFEWRVTYPGPDKKLGTKDDIHVLNNLHIPRGQPILIHLRSRDVLHSFFLPNFRIKQDAVPGMTIPVWFDARKDTPAKNFELMCAELCGWGHYKMKGTLVVHETQKDFDEWLVNAKKAEEATE